MELFNADPAKWPYHVTLPREKELTSMTLLDSFKLCKRILLDKILPNARKLDRLVLGMTDVTEGGIEFHFIVGTWYTIPQHQEFLPDFQIQSTTYSQPYKFNQAYHS